MPRGATLEIHFKLLGEITCIFSSTLINLPLVCSHNNIILVFTNNANAAVLLCTCKSYRLVIVVITHPFIDTNHLHFSKYQMCLIYRD